MHFLFDFLNFLKIQEKKYNVLNLSAQLAYRILLAFIPFTMLLYNFLNWFSNTLNAELIHGINLFFPNFTKDFISIATKNASDAQISSYTTIIFGFFILYASLCAIRSLILTVNKVMNIPEKRNYFIVWGFSFLYLILLIIAILIVIYLYLFTQHIITAFFVSLNWFDFFINFWRSFSLVYIITIITLLLTGIYMFIPSKHLSFFAAFPGAIFVSSGWLLVLCLYRYFIWSHINFIDFSTSLEGPFSMIIFIYLFCIILCFGCVVNLFFIKRTGD
ncbi:MAG: YhjD/YihY/BrkB family envelope integrity protein [Eubacterium sp.]